MKMKFVKYSAFTMLTFYALFMSACRDPKEYPGYEYMPDMYRSPSYETYDMNPMFKDSMGALKPVEGTLPRGFTPFPYDASNDGYVKAGAEAHNPLEKNVANLEEGKRLYLIYCAHCHGEAGDGQGILVQNGKFNGVPGYSSGNSSRGGLMSELTDGKIYHTMTYGVNMMGSHAAQLNPEERWKIVMHVHELQKGANASPADSSATVAPSDSTKK